MAMSSLSDWIQLYIFPPGRAIHALEHVRERAEGSGEENVVEASERALVEARRLYELEQRWARRRTDENAAEGAAVALQLDSRIDSVLGNVGRLLETLRKLHGPDDPDRGQPAARLLEALFPFGVFAVTSLSYAEQFLAVRSILEKMRGERADDVAALGLERTRNELADLLTGFATAIAPETEGDTLRFEDVQSARVRCQDALLAVVATILGAHPYGDIASIERRTRLLQPIEEQRDAIARDMRRRRNATDVEP